MAGNKMQFQYEITANNSQAKKALAELDSALARLRKQDKLNLGLSDELSEAATAAKILQKELNAAFNTTTGKLDISQLAQGLAAAGTSVDQLSMKFLNAGTMGQAAFRSLAQSIALADVPIKKMNTTLSNMMTTLKNTVKWELSSTAIHGLESALRGAVSYAKNLNTSLTNIRIVTGQSVEDMVRFTKEANTAAKALSTTTKSYTDASLIYYQQGDSQEMAAKKAAITIKAANASFETSAKEMSEYLTSVWNSYQVGADELEHYVDIMANLGAKTATSLEEIATSMQKVAATSNTVGVSMEQVSSIIATVSSVTRESAESIGTSYKTIFARIGDLKLGKADEDGIGLGQVSSQLDAIGVKILDESGNLREMGDIITDLGAKWQTMNEAQKTAVAQVVAGKRQYTQLMALFENWDMYQQNMDIATNSEGALQTMADTYAESWEAASERTKAALEGIYNSIFNDQALIKMANSTTKLLEGINDIVDGLGGLPGIVASVGTIFTTVFRNKITSSINTAITSLANWGNSFKGMSIGQGLASFFKGESSAMRDYQRMLNETSLKINQQGKDATNSRDKLSWEHTNRLIQAKQKLIAVNDTLSQQERILAGDLLSSAQSAIGDVEALTLEYEDQKKSVDNLIKSLTSLSAQQEAYEKKNPNKKPIGLEQAAQKMQQTIKSNWGTQYKEFEHNKQAIKNQNVSSIFNASWGGSTQLQNLFTQIPTDTAPKLEALVTRFRELVQVSQALGPVSDNITKLFNNLNKTEPATAVEKIKLEFAALRNVLQESGLQTAWLDNLEKELIEAAGDSEKFKEKLAAVKAQLEGMSSAAGTTVSAAFDILANRLGLSNQELIELMERAGFSADKIRELTGATNGASQSLDNFFAKITGAKSVGEVFSKIINGASAALSSFSSFSSALSNWDDSSFTSKVTSIGNSLTSIASMFASGNTLGGIMAIAGAGLGHIVGQQEREKKKLLEEQQKFNRESEDLSSRTQSEITENNRLMQSYIELANTYEKVGGSQDELKESAYALADAYELVGAKAKIAAGDFEGFNDLLETARIDKIEKQKDNLASSMSKIQQSVDNGGTYYDIKSSNLRKTFDVNVTKAVRPEAELEAILLEDLFIKNTSEWDASKMSSKNWAKEVYGKLSSLLSSETYQAVLDASSMTVNEKIEEIVRNLTGDPSFVLEQGKEQDSFVKAFKKSNLKVKDVYDAFNSNIAASLSKIDEPVEISMTDLAKEYQDIIDIDIAKDIISDEHGGIKWNELDFTAKKEAYLNYRDNVIPQIKEKQSEVYKAMQKMTEEQKDSPEYQALEEYSKYLNTILSDLDQITGSDGVIAKTFEQYLSDADAHDVALAWSENYEKHLKGKSTKNTNLHEFTGIRQSLFDDIDSNRSLYKSLDAFGDTSYDKMTTEMQAEYNEAVSEIIAGMLANTDFGDYFDVDALIQASVPQEHQDEVMKTLSDYGITSLDQINSALLTVLTRGIDETTTAAIEAILASGNQQTSTDEAIKNYESAKANQKLFKSDMDAEDRKSFLESFFKDASEDDILKFLNSSFDEKEQAIANIVKKREQTMITELKKQYEADKTEYEKIQAVADAAMAELGLDEKSSKEILEELKGYTYDSETQTYKNAEGAAFSKIDQTQHQQLKQYEAYVAEAEAAGKTANLSFGEWKMAKMTIEDTLSAMEKLQNQQSKLAVELSNLPKQGTAAWRRLREEILKTGQDLNNLSSSEQIEAISQAQIDNLDAQIRAKRLEYFDTESEVERAEISQAIADLQDQKDQIAVEVEAAYASLNDKTTAGIAAEWERANQKAQEQQEIAKILSSSVESGIISNEEAVVVGITADEWARYSVEVRAAKAASAALQGSSAMEQTLKNEQKAVDGAITYLEKYETSIKNMFADGRLEELLSGSFEAGNIDADSLKQFREVYNKIISEFGKDISSDKLIEEMSIRLGIDSKDLESQIKQVASSGKDAVNDIFSTMSRELQEKAQDAVDAWQEAFDKIAAAREKLASGGSLLEDIAGDPEALIFYAQQLGMSVEEAYNKIVSGMIDESQLKMPEFDLENAKAIYGLDKGIGQSRSQDAVALGYEESDIGTDAFQSKVIPYYQKILMASGKYTEDAALELATSIARGTESYDLITEGASHLAAALPLAAEAAETFAQRNIDAANIEKAAEIDQQKYDNQTELQAALEEARDVKKENGDWEDISSENRGILEANGITGLNQVDAAAIECASALAQLAQAAYEAAKKEAEDAGYTQNEDGAWGIQHTLTEEQGRLDYGSDWDQYKTTLTQNEDGTYNQGFEVIKEINDPLQEAEERVQNLRGQLEDLPTDLWEEEMEGFGLDPDEVDELGDSIQEMAESSDELADSLKHDAKAADEVAKELKRFDNAVESVKDNYDDWDKALKSDNIQKQSKAVKELDKAYSDMLDLDYDSLSDSFLTNAENLELMKEAAEGSEEAYKELQARAEDDLIIQAGIDINDQEAWNKINALQDKIHNGIDDIEIGANIDNAQAIQAMNELINMAGFTADQATNYLASMGVDAEVEQIEVPETQTYAGAVATVTNEPITWDMPLEAGGSGSGSVPSITYADQPLPVEGTKMATALRVTSAKKSSGGGFKMSHGSGGGGGKGGGGGSKPAKKEKKPHKRYKDETERYHKNNEVLSRISEELDKINKLKDRAYGAKHLKALDAETNALKEQADAQQALYDEAMKYAAADQIDVAKYGAKFDADGTITNYEDVVKRIVDEYNAAVDTYNNSAQEDGDKELLEAAEKRFDDAMQAIENYEEAIATANQAMNDLLETQNQISELETEKITYLLEYKIDMNERDLERLEYFQEKYADDLEHQDEAYAATFDTMLEYENNLAAIREAMAELDRKKRDGIINDEDYAEAMQEFYDQIYDNLSNLNEIQEQLVDTYANTLSLAREEIEKTTNAIDSANSTLQSYIDIIALAGGETDYEKMGFFYDQMNENNLTKINVQKAHLDALLEEEDKYQEKIRSGQQLTDLEKQQYQALQEEIQDARDTLMSSTTEALEMVRTTYENTINKISKDFEEFMVGAGDSIAHLQEQYGYFQEEQERYVSTAKELYEVSKLNRDIEGTLATTTSSAAKEALKALQEKINKQSELNQLTEYDIEMNQLQYQLLLARIKLEESQNAKDTVRLTRDEDGNYAYRYTANQDKIDEAAQNYEDILQQINDTTAQRTSEIENQMLETMAWAKEQMAAIATDYTLTEEEKRDRLEELNNQFAAKMQYLQEQNGIATENLMANQTAIAEHYGTNLSNITASAAGNVNTQVQSMIAETQKYVQAMNEALFGESGVDQNWKDYLKDIGIITSNAGTAYGDMVEGAEEMGEMTAWSAEQAQETIQTLTDTLKPLEALTAAWNAHNSILESTISDYESLADVIQGTLTALGGIANGGAPEGGTKAGTAVSAAEEATEEAMDGLIEQYQEITVQYAAMVQDNMDAVHQMQESYMQSMMNQNAIAAEEYQEVLGLIHGQVIGIADTNFDAMNTMQEQIEIYNEMADKYNKQNYELLERLEMAIEQMANQMMTSYISSANLITPLGPMEQYVQTLEQIVNVSADFPNASNVDEIREALLSLTNYAAQFANRKNS